MRMDWGNEKGAGFVEMIMAVGLFGLVGFFLSQFIENTQQHAKVERQRTATRQFTESEMNKVKKAIITSKMEKLTAASTNESLSINLDYFDHKSPDGSYKAKIATRCRSVGKHPLLVSGNNNEPYQYSFPKGSANKGYGRCINLANCAPGQLPYIEISSHETGEQVKEKSPTRISKGGADVVGAAACFKRTNKKIEIIIESLAVDLRADNNRRLVVISDQQSLLIRNRSGLRLIK